MRADQRKFHYIYKITRTDGSGKYYIGMHSTDDLEDGYFGSGMLLWKSIKKHGKEKHKKEILEFLSSRVELKTRERFLVNEEILDDPLCMNLKLGGEGGGKIWNDAHKEKLRQIAIRTSGATFKKYMNSRTTEQKSKDAIRLAEARKRNGTAHNWVGRKHSEQTKLKMSAAAKNKTPEQNSQFGTCWVIKNGFARKIRKDQLAQFIKDGFSKGRK